MTSFWISDFRFWIGKSERNRAFCFAVCCLLFALSVSAEAQQPAKIPRIGFLSGRATPTSATPDPNAEAFRQGLRELGYVEGKNILLELRYAEGKQELAVNHVAELV